MFEKDSGHACLSRRNFLRGGVGATAAGAAALLLPGQTQTAQAAGATDDFDPYPIPWLNVNLHHNQTPMPGGPSVELAHIWHFKGLVGRAILEGEGKTGDGRKLYIGRGTDYGYMHGEFITPSGRMQFGTFTHT